MHEVIRPQLLPALAHVSSELRHKRQQLFLADEARWAGRDVNDPHAATPIDNFRLGVVVPPCVDVNAPAVRGEMTRQLGHVDVLAATVDATKGPQRRCVLADHRYAAAHLTPPVTASRAA